MKLEPQSEIVRGKHMAVSASKGLLLSSVCRPFGAKYGDSFNVTSDGAHQFMWAQRPFRTFTTTTQWGIDLISENIEIPNTTLHFPTMTQWRREIKRGYDYTGVAFVHATRHKMIPMVEAARKCTPQSKIILGGYGAAFPNHELYQYADYICKGECVEFMRRLIGGVHREAHCPTYHSLQVLYHVPDGHTGCSSLLYFLDSSIKQTRLP